MSDAINKEAEKIYNSLITLTAKQATDKLADILRFRDQDAARHAIRAIHLEQAIVRMTDSLENMKKQLETLK